MTAPAPQTLPLDIALQQAVAHHQAGRLHEAEQLYRAILQALPYQPNANHNLGVLAGQVGQHVAGLPYLKTALDANPFKEEYWLSYTQALLASGQSKEALNILQSSIRRGFNSPAAQSLLQRAEAAVLNASAKENTPTPAELNKLIALFNAGNYVELEDRARLLLEEHSDNGFVWKMLGASLYVQGKNALPALKKATRLLPDDAETHNNLGIALRDFGQLDSAEASCRRALEINPDFADAHNSIGIMQRDLCQIDNAVASFRHALKIKPDYADAHNNLGVALQSLGQLNGAVASYRRALEINPDFADALFNLGVGLQDLGQPRGAEMSYRRALEIKPDYAEAYLKLGNTLHGLGQLDDAVANYRLALEINSDNIGAHNNLGVALQDIGQLDDAVECYHRALEIQHDFTDSYSNLLFVYNLRTDHSTADMLAEAKRFGDIVARKARPYSDWRNVPESDRCLRVGIVSGDLKEHPVGHFVEGVLTALVSTASGRLEFFAYSNNFCSDAVTKRIKSCCQVWHSAVALSDEQLAQRIRDDGVDILIDLSGHTAHNRLPMFAWKPAPVQASWLGYFATTGVAAIDYLIADPWTVPEAEESHFAGKIWRLPETYLCFSPPGVEVQVAPLPALTNGYVTFGSFNNLTKMNDTVVALWARVLLATPGSRLFLKTKQLGEATVRQRTIARFAAHGIDADRLILEGAAPRAELLASYQRVDIALDPFPYPGGATSVEALWMGVPVLTLAGKRFLSHIGESILQNAGLPEWIAADADDYVARAALHAADLQRLASLRDRLRQQVLASPIFDAPRFARHFEAALRDMWREWCASRIA